MIASRMSCSFTLILVGKKAGVLFGYGMSGVAAPSSGKV